MQYTPKNKHIRTHVLKVDPTDEDSTNVLDRRIKALTSNPVEYWASNTADYKLIPFQNNAIGRDGLTKLIARQNEFLHNTTVISVVHERYCDARFEDDVEIIAEMDTNHRTTDGKL